MQISFYFCFDANRQNKLYENIEKKNFGRMSKPFTEKKRWPDKKKVLEMINVNFSFQYLRCTNVTVVYSICFV